MKIQIDLKSALFGLVIGVAAMFAVGAGFSTIGNNDVGRYQISTGNSFAVMVDTKTGQAYGFGPISSAQYRNDGNFWDAK